MNDAVFSAGVLSTGSDLVFTGTSGDNASEPAAVRLVDRYVYALDARTGEVLWKMALTGPIYGAPITYAAVGKQYVAIAAGNALFAFALRN
jgi:outer membrane protein assembly factor BamB